MDISNLIGESSKEQRDAKWNLFKFQDHLLNWIAGVAGYFQEKDYLSMFDALSNLYFDSNGFYSDEEKKKLEKLYEQCLTDCGKYSDYINKNRGKRKGVKFEPPTEHYFSLIKFRKKLMEYMTKHQLLIPMVKKGDSGAGSQ